MEHQQSLNTNHEASTIIRYKSWNINICLIQIMKNQYIFLIQIMEHQYLLIQITKHQYLLQVKQVDSNVCFRGLFV